MPVGEKSKGHHTKIIGDTKKRMHRSQKYLTI